MPMAAESLISELVDIEHARQTRIAQGMDVGDAELLRGIARTFADLHLPAWAKYVHWIRDPDVPDEDDAPLIPRLGGMALVNKAYGVCLPWARYEITSLASDREAWGRKIANTFGGNDWNTVCQEAGPKFWHLIAGSTGPSFYEEIEAESLAPAIVDVEKFVVRDRTGVIRFCCGICTGIRTSAWRGRQTARVPTAAAKWDS